MADEPNSQRPPSRPRLGAWCVFSAAIAWGLLATAVPVAAQPQKPAKAEADKAAPGKTDSDLPPDYEPPRDPPELMLLEQPLLTPEERKEIKRELSKKYSTPLRMGNLRDEKTRTDVRNGIRYRLNELTLPANRRNLAEIRKRLTGTGQDLNTAGKVNLKPDQAIEFRRKLLDMVVEETAKLFDNNYYVRIQAALILGELNLVEEDPAKDIKAEAFSPAAKPLYKVLGDPQQPDGVKIVCVLSLIRILHHGNPTVDIKRDIGEAVEKELKRTDTNFWYQTRLAESLGYNDVALNLDRQPFIYNILLAVLKDPNRHLRTRVQAAWSLGRHPLTNNANIPQMIVDVSALGRELALAQAAEPKNAAWRRCGLVLYLAFEKKDDNDLDAKRDRKGGFLNNPSTKADAEAAFKVVLPLLREAIAEKPIPQDLTQNLEKWLQAKGFKQPPAGQHGGDPDQKQFQ